MNNQAINSTKAMAKLDAELTFYRYFTSRLPRAAHMSGIANRIVKPLYLRKQRSSVIAPVLSFSMLLDPNECVDGNLLFCPQLYDWREVALLRTLLGPGDVFLDVGANIGFYSLAVSEHVGDGGRVISIEADPYNFKRLLFNIQLNHGDNISPLQVGVSDTAEVLQLSINCEGNRGGNSFVPRSVPGTTLGIQCRPLLEVLQEAGVTTVTAAKFDIEGFEIRVLPRFLETADRSLHPLTIITEVNPQLAHGSGKTLLHVLESHGYTRIASWGLNQVFRLGQFIL